MKSKNKKRLLALVLCMVVAISNSSFIFASENAEADYSQEAEVQTESEPAADDAAVATYAEEEAQPVAEEQPVVEQTTAEQPVAVESEEAAPAVEEQPTAEAPATTEEPAAEEPATTDNGEATPAAEAPANEEATPEEEEPAQEETTQQLTWSAKVGDATVNVTAEAGALPEDAQLSVTEITSEKETEEIEKAVEKKAIEEQFSIKNILSYDIKFLVNGSEVQPTTPVQVSVDTPKITADQDAAVLHVDDNNVAEDMNGTVDGEGNVVFDAPHFSRYVIVQKGDSDVVVTIQHFDKTSNTKIYADDERTLPVGGKINDYTKASNWDVSEVYLVETATDGTETKTKIENPGEADFEATKDCTIRVYYTPKTGTVDGSTTFYDYTVKAIKDSELQYNNYKYYSFNMLGDEPKDGKKLTSGTSNQNYNDYKYSFQVPNSSYYANAYTGSKDVVKGLLKGLDADGKVEFNYPEPGFFSNNDATCTVNVQGKNGRWSKETRYLRKVYKNLKLGFSQSGDTYTLENVKDSSGNILTTAGNDFYPLDGKNYKLSYENAATGHNYFFGMRYDVTFKLGDYVGELNYKFTGDDDLWVLLDGNVVLDLGGIHGAATGEVDLWKELGKTPGQLTTTEKEQEHTLTVLYMERGAGQSNCQMEFTLPSARISEVEQVPMAELNLQKVNKKGEGLEGAIFSLVNQATGEKQTAISAGENGTVRFSRLREGTYTLTEDAAPSGYIPSVDSWTVKVKADSNGTAIATLYLADGITEYQDKSGSFYQIINLTKEEIIDSSMNYDKTAHVVDWQDRKYKIDITASSKLTTPATVEKEVVADVMMVLDTSGSMLYESDSEYNDAKGFSEVGTYKNVKGSLDTTKVYYYTNETTEVAYSKWKYTNAEKPMIYLNGKWMYYNGNSWQTIDSNSSKIIYTIDSSLTGLKEAGTAFISSMAESSPQSRIGMVTFNSVEQLQSGLTNVSGNRDTLIKQISSIRASAGTSPQLGLAEANTELNKDVKENIPRYVVLFTDGEPSEDSDRTASETQADLLKQEGIIVYTIGLNLNSSTREWLASKIASQGCAFAADNINELKEAFKKIQETINQDLDIKSAQIKDVIDPRFVILDDEGKQITSNYPGIENGIKLSNGGTVYYDKDSSYQYIVWNEQTIPNSKTGEWHKIINVQAREDYIGGNDVTTNISPDSKISTGYGDAILPQPTVNVRAELDIADKNITIYKGDSLPDSDTVLQEMFDLVGNVNRYHVNKDDFTVKWYDKDGNEIDISKIKAEEGTYHLKVTYDAGIPTAESNANTDGEIAGGADHIVEATKKKEDGTDERDYGIYTIHVISGEIRLIKKLETALAQDQNFVFNVKMTKKDGTETTIKVPITVKAGQKEATYEGELLTDLARGTYTITEIVPDGYVLTDYAIASADKDTNCENSDDSEKESVTFKLGYEKNEEDVDVIKDYTYKESDGGTIGTVAFTNEKATTNWDIVKVSTSGTEVHLEGAEFILLDKNNKTAYTGTSDANGKIIWKKGNDEVANLEKGTYTLVEKKAPLGYVLSTEKWTITVTKNGSLVAVTTDKNGQEIEKSTISVEDATLHLYFKNDVVYDLPSTGHTGIFNIMMSGILLMFAGILIIFKMKSKGVLKR